MDHDLILRNGRVLDPGTGRDETTDIAFSAGKVSAIGAGLQGRAERDVSGCVVMPGNIDFHAHVYWGGTSISIDADGLSRRCGTTTWLDVGSAGRATSPGSASTSWKPARPVFSPTSMSAMPESTRSRPP